MAFNTSRFVSSEQFTLPDEIFQKLRSSAFLTGISSSKEQTRGVVEAALNVGADRASTREAQARQFALGQEELEIRKQRNEAIQAFEFEQIRGQERATRSQAIAGVGQLAGLALFSPIFSSSTGAPTTIAGKIFKLFSSIRYKENVSDVGSLNSERIYDLKPVSYNYKEDKEKTIQFGLIAEEVAKVIPEMVDFDEQGRPDKVDYAQLIVLLLNELKEVKKALSMEVI